MNGSRAALAAAAFAALLIPASCAPQEPAAGVSESAPVRVRTARVGGGGDGWIEVPGSVEAANAAALASRLSATIDQVAVEEGDFVHAGDVLIRLDGRDVAARLQAAEAALRSARAQRDRLRDLFAKDASTRQELDVAEAAEAAAAAERDSARAQLDYIEIRAPFDGRVTEKHARAGDLARPGETLMTIQGVGLMRVSATASEAQARLLKRGAPVEVVLEDGSAVTAHLSVLSQAGDPASLRFLVKCDLPKSSGARAGSFARLRLPGGGEEPRALVPRRALVERGALTGVFVVEDGRARLRWISPGEPAGDALQVRAGLTPGEEIILEPGSVADGQRVEATPVAGPARSGAGPPAAQEPPATEPKQ
jgi:RND family efflux transporter MFP subunit